MRVTDSELSLPKPTGARVVAPYASTLWDAALAAGVPLQLAQTLWQRARVGEADVPREAYLALLQAAAQAGGASFGWTLGQHVRPTTYGVNGILVLACATLGDALVQTLRFESLVHDLGRSTFDRSGELAIYQWRNDCRHHPSAGVLAESVFSGVHTCAQWLCGQPLTGVSVEFEHPVAPTARAFIESCLGGSVHGRAPANRVIFPASMLEQTIPQANTALLPLLQQHADALLQARHPHDAGIVAQVRQRISARLGQGAVKLADVAADLALSTRTLQRRLEQAGVAFQGILDATRHELACHYLRHTTMPIAEVGSLLGFQDAPAFHHAFKSWQGQGPGQYRASLAG
ncbi:AraC family transcriptional regulator ligand-binding domain-containing protein [Curvibacter sp. APW13]|uniref:helix-turn-helix domain-containing protein n=1 Tax=Curvibacter sp. APW13 TaxID=3077236 RepID=UPI0028E09057|nr:AraC family transcriptional regulator ligand-binding domain-containing protein [Curvibacter sp. APW13]MDT8992289.1 AraC family transcriptional regulator ligand-binding domain-containing protein [Curvibacter sp. APW13]